MLYLAWFDAPDADTAALAGEFGGFPLASGLMLLVSDVTRSRVYHSVKWALPPDTPLLVAPLADVPKFKKMTPGTQTWLRETAER